MKSGGLVAYVQQLGRQADQSSYGRHDGRRGRSSARRLRAVPHDRRAGGSWGRNLSDIGDRRAVRHIRQSDRRPQRRYLARLSIRSPVTDAKGTTSGIHLTEDEYSIHLRDLAEPAVVMKTRSRDDAARQSLMPANAALTATDVETLSHTLRP